MLLHGVAQEGGKWPLMWWQLQDESTRDQSAARGLHLRLAAAIVKLHLALGMVLLEGAIKG